MASSDTAANDSIKTSTKRASANRAAPKSRATARAKGPSTQEPSFTKRSDQWPKWATAGAVVAGAIVAVGATLFANRDAWLPRARKISDRVGDSVSEQGNVSNKSDGAPNFEPSGASAGFEVGAAAH